ncbi:RlpA-like double-psi beta-barrel-protein domain-containing protein-containing protein, partial [Multifurca ochricompacta]
TFFFQGGVAGACGKVHSDNDFIAAIDEKRYGFSGAVSSLCGKRVKITNTENGKTVIVTIADDCPTCKNANSIDLSVAAFKAIAPLSAGIAPISWSFI